MQARCQGDKCACCFFKYRSLSSESSESNEESESEEVKCETISYILMLHILTFLFGFTAEPGLLNRLKGRIAESRSGSASEFLKMLCKGVIMLFDGVACGVIPNGVLTGESSASLSFFLDLVVFLVTITFVADLFLVGVLLLDFVDFLLPATINFFFDLLRLLFDLIVFFLSADVDRRFFEDDALRFLLRLRDKLALGLNLLPAIIFSHF